MSRLMLQCLLKRHGFFGDDHEDDIFIAMGPVSWDNIRRKAEAFEWVHLTLLDDEGMVCPVCWERIRNDAE